MHPYGERAGRAAEHTRRFAQTQPVPGNQQQGFALDRPKLAQRSEHSFSAAKSLGVVVSALAQRLADSLNERLLATSRTALISEHTTSHTKQPRPGLVRHVRQPTPGDLKGPRERVDGRLAIGPRSQVASDRPNVLNIERFKALLVSVRASNSGWSHIREVARISNIITPVRNGQRQRRPERPPKGRTRPIQTAECRQTGREIAAAALVLRKPGTDAAAGLPATSRRVKLGDFGGASLPWSAGFPAAVNPSGQLVSRASVMTQLSVHDAP